jgi:hypothetical protein
MNPHRAIGYIELITAAGVFLTAFKWAFMNGRRLPRHRVRLHLGKGQATVCRSSLARSERYPGYGERVTVVSHDELMNYATLRSDDVVDLQV